MTPSERPADATATVTVRVAVPPERAFELFTTEIDFWWRRGRKYRHSSEASSVLSIESGVGGRVVETWTQRGESQAFELGRVTAWRAPAAGGREGLLRFTWRNATFGALERTEVEVRFEGSASGTLVTVRHRGWEALRPDHPARHGQDDFELARSVGLWWGDLLSSLRERAAPD